eukprot:m.82304 g.82304  ORF g.82304 m.82304 type:complete len:52 (-) comp12082_c0_seq2:606-761(-)
MSVHMSVQPPVADVSITAKSSHVDQQKPPLTDVISPSSSVSTVGSGTLITW